MSTSLAEQLKNLAVPQTSTLQRDKKRPSLLFDPKEAAGFKRETVYQIGLDGLKELILKNKAFSQFKNSLFHITAKELERSVKDKEINEQLNKNVKKFLLLLSPYFMLNCSHKALEWLINRFSIHEYNREELLMLILPYHETNMFVRVLQLLQFKEAKDNFYFLKALQKPGIHLPKQAILNHAASNPGFLKFVTTYIFQLMETHDEPNILLIAFNFYCSIITGFIEYSGEVNEAQISQILPLILRGLCSCIPDFCAASYVVTARLLVKTTLSDKLLDVLVNKISTAKVFSLNEEMCLVLVVLYQSQKQYNKIPEKAILNLSKLDWLPSVLESLNKSGSLITPFLENLMIGFVKSGIDKDLSTARDILKDCLDILKLDENFIATFFKSFLKCVDRKLNYSDNIKDWITEIVQTLERQYPEIFDREVYHILKSNQKKTIECLTKIIKNTMTYEGKFKVFEQLYHPSANIRSNAIKFMVENYQSLKENDREILKNSFLDCLNGGDKTVVKETLAIIRKTNVYSKDELRKIYLELLGKLFKNQSEWEKICKELVKYLCLNCDFNDSEVFLTVFPILLPKNEQNLKTAKELLQTDFFSKNCLLESKLKKLESKQDAESFCKLILISLSNNKNLDVLNKMLEIIKNKESRKGDVYNEFIMSIILSHTLPNGSSIDVSMDTLEIIIGFFENTTFMLDKGKKSSINNYLKVALKNKVPLNGFLKCVEEVVKKTKKTNLHLGTLDFTSVELNKVTKYFKLILKILINDDPIYGDTLEIFLNYFCNALQERIDFLLNLLTSEHKDSSENVLKKKEILLYLLKLLEMSNVDDIKTLISYEKSITVAFILIQLFNDDEDARNTTFIIINLLLKVSTKKSSSYFYLLEALTKNREEILTDKEQLPLIIFNVLDSSNTKNKKHTSDLNSIRSRLLQLVTDHNAPIYLRNTLLKLFSHINSIAILENVSEVAVKILAKNQNKLDPFRNDFVKQTIERINFNLLTKANVTTTNTLQFIKLCIKNDTILINDTQFCSSFMLSHLAKEDFSVLDEKIIKYLLDLITEVSTKTTNPEVLPAANRIFKHLDLDCNIILEQLIIMKDRQSPKMETQKKRRLNILPTLDILDTLDWKKGISILEFIQDKKKIRNTKVLLPVLFGILKKCLDFDEQAAVEYPKQLVLSSILLCCQKIKEGEVLPENIFNMELIVECIRASQNPQTHHHALLVLAHSAELIPTQVLHHIMAIFTFMGSSVLRHEDAYTFQIITKIVDTIVPILVKDSQVENIVKVLRVFVDALLDVPEHRRMPLYRHLLEKIGAEENLYLFLLIVFSSHVSNSNHKKPVKENVPKKLDVAAEICRSFPPKTVIYSCGKLIKYLTELPNEKDNDKNFKDVFLAENSSPKDFRHYKYLILKFTGSLLASEEFVYKVAALKHEEERQLEELFKQIIVNILQYIQRISVVTEKLANSPQNQYWKVVLHHSYDILDGVNALLTSQMFLLVTQGLMSHKLSVVRRRILELLTTKLQYNLQFFNDCDKKDIYFLILALVSIIEGIDKDILPEQEIIIQTALLSLKLLIKALASEEPQKYVQILEMITKCIKTGKAQNNLLASFVLCLAELCLNLKAHAIASLPDFMPAIIKILKGQRMEDTPSVLSRSVITAVEKILDSVPLFLNPYLEKLLFELSILMSKWGISGDDAKLQPLVNKLVSIRKKIGSLLPARVLIPAINKSYTALLEKEQFIAIGSLMSILSENLNNLQRTEINSNLNDLTNFFLEALKYRSREISGLAETNEIESHVVQALVVLILKLSESNFRPLYFKLFDWAVRSESKKESLITFYNLSSIIAESLKGLFVLFAGHFLSNASEMLDACNVTKSEQLCFKEDEKNILLLEKILKTINTVFLYDNQMFINKERFDVLMQPLVDQLENTLGGVERLQARNQDFVTPCLINFAVATADDASWKQMNYQILLKMRSSDASIRLIALHCLTELVKKLGEDFLPLLPETIPFLSELLEDDEENVEKACQKAVQEMEKVLGEPLQKYF